MKTMNKKPSALILWGNHFDEAMAITYIASLRQGGIGVQLVGIQGRIASGRDSVTICADITLSDAYPLAQQASVVIVPTHSPSTGILANDPRVLRFLVEARAHGATFVTGQLSEADAEIFPVPIHRIESIGSPSEYTAAAETLRRTLQNIASSSIDENEPMI